MDFDLNDEERAVVSAVRSLMRSRPAPSDVPGDRAPFDDAVWETLAHDLGLVPMALPESVGGDGGGVVLAGLVVRELGAGLYGGPYLSCLLGAFALADSQAEAARDLLGRTIDGSARPTYAPSGRVPVHARRTTQGWTVDGVAPAVLDAATASHVVVEAVDEAGAATHVLVDLDADGVVARPVPAFDLTRETGTVTFSSARAVALDVDHDRVVHHAKALVASEQLGGSRSALAMAVEHAKNRHQFGRPIGSFQSIKHQLADVLVGVELAEVTADHVLCLLAAREPVRELAATALAMTSDAYSRAALVAMHTHGGLGITWEAGLHLHVRRAKATSALLGNPAQQRRIALADLGW